MENIHKKVVRIISQDIEVDWLEPYKNKRNSSSIGSGFFIDNGGVILTCSHLVIDAKKIFIEVPSEGKEKYEAEIIMTCPDYDIAIIRAINYKNEHYLELLHKDFFYDIKPGTEIKAIGFPLGQDNLKITQGIISGRDNGLIQTSAALNSGNSGGPMLYNDIVIGINVSKIFHASNIGYASPIIYYYNIENLDYTKDKLIRMPILGIHFTNLDKSYLELNDIKCETGVLIKHVHKKSPLWNCGIRKGHILCKLDGYEIDNYGLSNRYWYNEKMSINDLRKTFKINQKVPISYFNKKKLVNTSFKFTPFDLTIRKKYSFYDFDENSYEVFGGIIACDLNINILKMLLDDNFSLNYRMTRLANLYNERDKEKIIVTFIFPNAIINNQDIISTGDIIKSVNNIDIKNIIEYRKALEKPLIKKNKKYIKIVTEDNKELVLDLNKIMKEELSNKDLFKYKLSKIYKSIKNNKNNKQKKKNKKHSIKKKQKLKDKRK